MKGSTSLFCEEVQLAFLMEYNSAKHGFLKINIIVGSFSPHIVTKYNVFGTSGDVDVKYIGEISGYHEYTGG